MISKEEIENLATLSRLRLTPQEITALERDFSAILDYVSQIQAVTSPEEGIALVPVRNIMRDDAPYAPEAPMEGKQKSIIEEFPRREGDYLLVRKIIQKDE
jgi:aspartyl/glutamyl-tRNA(Asn/Gln) amidotransferase C subunit